MSSQIESTDSKQSNLVKKLGAALVAILGFVIFAAVSASPIVFFTKEFGGAIAFAIWAPIYGFGSYIISVWLCGIYDKRSGDTPSRMAKFVEGIKESNMHDDKKGFWWRAAETGGFLGFALACFFLGAIVTVFLVNYSTQLESLRKTAAVGSLIFAVTFVGLYSGAFALIFG